MGDPIGGSNFLDVESVPCVNSRIDCIGTAIPPADNANQCVLGSKLGH